MKTIAIVTLLVLGGCSTEPVELPGDTGCTCQVELRELQGTIDNIVGFAGWIDSRLTALEQLHDAGADADAGEEGEGDAGTEVGDTDDADGGP